MGKPSWNDAPLWAEYLAIDIPDNDWDDGEWY